LERKRGGKKKSELPRKYTGKRGLPLQYLLKEALILQTGKLKHSMTKRFSKDCTVNLK